jgi:hypothetical protein
VTERSKKDGVRSGGADPPWEDKCPRSKAGQCIYVALQKLLGTRDVPTVMELNAQIDPIFQKRRKMEAGLTREDCGREGDAWCMEVVERALSLKHRRNLIFKKVKAEDIEGSHLPLLVIGTLNKACGFEDDGLPEHEWCHAIAVVSVWRKWGRRLRRARRIFDNNLAEEGLAVSKLITGKPHPYLTRVIRRYHIALKETPLLQEASVNFRVLSEEGKRRKKKKRKKEQSSDVQSVAKRQRFI